MASLWPAQQVRQTRATLAAIRRAARFLIEINVGFFTTLTILAFEAE